MEPLGVQSTPTGMGAPDSHNTRGQARVKECSPTFEVRKLRQKEGRSNVALDLLSHQYPVLLQTEGWESPILSRT